MFVSLKSYSAIYRSVLWVEGGITPFTLSWVNPTSCKGLTQPLTLPSVPSIPEAKIEKAEVRKFMGQVRVSSIRKVRRGGDSEKASPTVFKFSGCWFRANIIPSMPKIAG